MTSPDKPHFVLPAEEPAEPAPARASTSVILARDGDQGLEVFMLERHLNSDFAGGAYVFPGGKLDDADRDAGYADLMDGWPGALATDLGADDPEVARALVICAIREVFEEAGILLARGRDGTALRLEAADTLLEIRRALQSGEHHALERAQRARIRFGADMLRFWTRWVTPVLSPRRYDTWFFIAVMPDGQTGLHEGVETTASVWIRPAEAIRQGLSGERSIIFPTRKMLESLLPYPSAAALFDAAVGRPNQPIMPRIVIDGDQAHIVLPDGSIHAP